MVVRYGVPGLAQPSSLRHTGGVKDPSQFDDTEMTPEEFRARLAGSIPADLYLHFATPTGNASGHPSSDVLPVAAIGQLVHWGQEPAFAR